MTSTSSPFAVPPATVPTPGDCYFYHTTDVPGHGTFKGEWDLRPGVEAYLGRVAFAGRTVLDVGAATGFLTFHMERSGARVVSYDLSPAYDWDVVPLSGFDVAGHAKARKAHIGAINAGYWLCHAAHGSSARLAHGTVYDIDPAIGQVDIGVFGSILLHLRDPFRALHSVAQITGDTLVVTELLPGGPWLAHVRNLVASRSMGFKPRFARNAPWETWWSLPPRLVVEFLGVLGFERTTVAYHRQLLLGRRMPMYTVVGTRTKSTVPIERR